MRANSGIALPRAQPPVPRSLERPPHEHRGQVALVLGRAVEARRRVETLATRAARRRRCDAPCASASSTPRARTAVGATPREPDAPALRALRHGDADERPVDRPPVELDVGAPRLAAGDADRRDELARPRARSCSSR